eukprot:TRINITY_DN2812_c0_g1_i2.p2 TRINITY_DN2812_c0_g1~~TRINITY_DN2812_c0_g1_i2.p2  ORF type:complete len:183 (+),score=88.93 TRINITY_DN2812_c0_g1_i2:505-1053(+)
MDDVLQRLEGRVRGLMQKHEVLDKRIHGIEDQVEQLREKRDLSRIVFVMAFLTQKHNIDERVDPDTIFGRARRPSDPPPPIREEQQRSELSEWLAELQKELKDEVLAHEAALQEAEKRRLLEEAGLLQPAPPPPDDGSRRPSTANSGSPTSSLRDSMRSSQPLRSPISSPVAADAAREPSVD